MEVVSLKLGQRPADDTDCIKIEETCDRRFALTGTVLCQQAEVEAESVSLIETATFEKMSEAEEAGIAWADAQGVQVLHIGYGTLDHPLEQSVIEKPL